MTNNPSTTASRNQGFALLARLERRWILALAREKSAGRLALDMAEDAVHADQLKKMLVLGDEHEELEALSALRRARLPGVQIGLIARLLKLRPTRDALVELSSRLRAESLGAALMATEAVLEARNALVTEHLGLVQSLLSKNRSKVGGKDIDGSDLFQEATFAVMRAVDRFRTAEGNAFATYASRGILGALVQNSIQQRQIIGIPEDSRSLKAQVAKARAQHQLKTGQQPSLLQLAQTLGLAPERIREMDGWGHAYLGLDAGPTGAEGDKQGSFQDCLAGDAPDPGERLDQEAVSKHLGRAIKDLGDLRASKAVQERLRHLREADAPEASAHRHVQPRQPSREEVRAYGLLRQNPNLRKAWESVA